MPLATLTRLADTWAALPEPLRRLLLGVPGWVAGLGALAAAIVYVAEPHFSGVLREAAGTEAVLARVAKIEALEQRQTEQIARLSGALDALSATLQVSEIECSGFPPTGHFVGDGTPGAAVPVIFRNVTRQRERCGRPEITPTIYDGQNFLRSAKISFAGVSIPNGATVTIQYELIIPTDAEPGPAQYCPELDFRHARPPAVPQLVPCVDFTILAPARGGKL